jgi:type IV secretory pathway VirB6-like protein
MLSLTVTWLLVLVVLVNLMATYYNVLSRYIVKLQPINRCNITRYGNITGIYNLPVTKPHQGSAQFPIFHLK